jgi:hypothetical protein
MRFVELIDISLRDPLLLVVGKKYDRTILRAPVGTLPIQLCRVVRYQIAVSEIMDKLRVRERLRLKL